MIFEDFLELGENLSKSAFLLSRRARPELLNSSS
jgi:hypothetical protein